MDLLVDIIVQIVKALTKPQQQLPTLTPQQAAVQQTAMQQRLAAMQKAMAAQQARVQPRKAGRPPSGAKPVAPPPVPPPRTRPLAATATPVAAIAPRRANAPSGLLVPLILGEILAPPLALREPEL
jgi:hypothetical protein